MDVRTLYTKIRNSSEHQVQEMQVIMESFLKQRSRSFSELNHKEQAERLISEANLEERQHLYSCTALGVDVRVGDICFIDFGADAYQCEIGFQHFGIIMKLFHGKAFVIPMSGNPSAAAQAYDEQDNPRGKRHLMRMPHIEGLNKQSTLFLNDCKFINTARIIDVKAHVDRGSPLFQKIHSRMRQVIG